MTSLRLSLTRSFTETILKPLSLFPSPARSKFSHELVGGAAAFEATRLYEQREAREGKPQNHALAKEIIAGIAGAEVDKLFGECVLDQRMDKPGAGSRVLGCQ